MSGSRVVLRRDPSMPEEYRIQIDLPEAMIDVRGTEAMSDTGTDVDRPTAPDLWTLIGAYLNQDWDLDYDNDVWEAVRDFRSGTSAPRVAGAADQARWILDGDWDEAQLKAIFDHMGLGYHPPGDGWTYGGWLTELEKVLRSDA